MRLILIRNVLCFCGLLFLCVRNCSGVERMLEKVE